MLTSHHVATEWQLIHFCLLPPQVKDVDLRRETLGTAFSYSTRNTVQGSSPWDTRNFGGVAKGNS